LLSVENLALVSAILGLGFVVEAVAGFGGTVVALSLGARWFSIDQLLAWFLPLNLALSTYLAVRHRRHVDRALLARQVLPAMLLGLAGGTALSAVLTAEGGARVFAAIVVAVAVFELARLLATTPAAAPPAVRRPVQLAVLAVAGVVHGLFATGGPLAVAVINRSVPDKATLRATLAVLWLTLNAIVATRLAVDGALSSGTLPASAALVPALAVGIFAGEAIHRRVPERPFRYVVAGLLGATGVLLLTR
jgi:uncharacterized membrane protein YfcA